MTISEIAANIHKSYTFVRNRLLASGTTPRSKEESARLFIEKHPQWSKQFIKYHIDKSAEATDNKIILLTMVITEGYQARTSVGFTNTQDSLHARFQELLVEVYGNVRVGRTGTLSRVSSVEIAEDIGRMMPGKSFAAPTFRQILKSSQLIARVLRTIADTEGSMIISVRRAPRNYTVESRIVLASTKREFRSQISDLLSALGIGSRSNADGVIVNRKNDLKRFVRMVGFSPGVNVVRKKAGLSSWYGKEKYLLSRLCLRVYAEQENAKRSGMRGCFVRCTTRGDVVDKLAAWYEELEGGER